MGGSIMTKVFIVVRKVAYEGDTIERVFATYNDAVKYADELAAELDLPLDIDYDVFEREVY
jgi:hypothetical protein